MNNVPIQLHCELRTWNKSKTTRLRIKRHAKNKSNTMIKMPNIGTQLPNVGPTLMCILHATSEYINRNTNYAFKKFYSCQKLQCPTIYQDRLKRDDYFHWSLINELFWLTSKHRQQIQKSFNYSEITASKRQKRKGETLTLYTQ